MGVILHSESLNIIIADFECAGDEVLVESSPPGSPAMAARLAQPTQVRLDENVIEVHLV